jgi:hypothetical protein
MGNGLRPAGSRKENDTVANPRMNLKKRRYCKAMVTEFLIKNIYQKRNPILCAAGFVYM